MLRALVVGFTISELSVESFGLRAIRRLCSLPAVRNFSFLLISSSWRGDEILIVTLNLNVPPPAWRGSSKGTVVVIHAN